MGLFVHRAPDEAGSTVETPVVTDTSASGGSGVAASSATSTGTATVAEAAPSFPAVDSFSWDAWDGKVEVLPEPVRPWADRVSGHYRKQLEAEAAKLADFDAWFGGLKDNSGESDSAKQLVELTEQLRAIQTERDTHKSTVEQVRAELAAYQRKVHEAASKSFLEANREVLAIPGATDGFAELISEQVDIDAGVAIAILKHGAASGNLAEVVKSAIELKKGGAADKFLLKLLGVEAPKVKPPETSVVQQVSVGGTGTGKVGDVRPKPRTSAEVASLAKENLVRRARELRSRE